MAKPATRMLNITQRNAANIGKTVNFLHKTFKEVKINSTREKQKFIQSMKIPPYQWHRLTNRSRFLIEQPAWVKGSIICEYDLCMENQPPSFFNRTTLIRLQNKKQMVVARATSKDEYLDIFDQVEGTLTPETSIKATDRLSIMLQLNQCLLNDKELIKTDLQILCKDEKDNSVWKFRPATAIESADGTLSIWYGTGTQNAYKTLFNLTDDMLSFPMRATKNPEHKKKQLDLGICVSMAHLPPETRKHHFYKHKLKTGEEKEMCIEVPSYSLLNSFVNTYLAYGTKLDLPQTATHDDSPNVVRAATMKIALGCIGKNIKLDLDRASSEPNHVESTNLIFDYISSCIVEIDLWTKSLDLDGTRLIEMVDDEKDQLLTKYFEEETQLKSGCFDVIQNKLKSKKSEMSIDWDTQQTRSNVSEWLAESVNELNNYNLELSQTLVDAEMDTKKLMEIWNDSNQENDKFLFKLLMKRCVVNPKILPLLVYSINTIKMKIVD